uniref:Myb/SANT-like DNA-binding domain-containing protein n=1 Tax=Anopheles culicifacies TaxID=139723 RepID=A0A182M6Q3_9DIPT
MSKRNAWSRAETLELLDILRSSCIPFLDGTINNKRGQMYCQVVNEMQRRGLTTNRDARQIEHKWKNLKFAYDRYKAEVAERENNESKSWLTELKPCEFYKELQELFSAVEQRLSNVGKTSADETFVTYYDEEFVTDETQELAVDDDAVVIEEIVYDSQDALDFEEAAAAASSSKTEPQSFASAPTPPAPQPPPTQKRKKLTAENMDGLLVTICALQRDHNDFFNRCQMEFIENEFESFREKEREHMLQLKLELEVLKQKFLARIQKIASGEGTIDTGGDEPVASESKRRRSCWSLPAPLPDRFNDPVLLSENDPPADAAAAAAAAAFASAAIRAAAAAACRPALERSSRFRSGTPIVDSRSSPLRGRLLRVVLRPPDGVLADAASAEEEEPANDSGALDSQPLELAASVLERVDLRADANGAVSGMDFSDSDRFASSSAPEMAPPSISWLWCDDD